MSERLRLLPVVASAWTAALLTTMLPGVAPAVAVGCWIVTGALVIVLARDPAGSARRWGVVAVLAVAAAAAAASHVSFAQPARSHLVELAVDGGRAIEVRASVMGKVERRADGSLAFDALADDLRVGSDAHVVRAEIAVRVQPHDIEPGDVLDVGAQVLVRGHAARAHTGERAVIDLRASRGVVVVAPAAGMLAVTSELRRGLVASTAGLPGAGAGLVPGLAVGDTTAVDDDLDAAMKRSSLSHLTAVSGANCALVVGLAYVAAAGLGAGRRLRIVIALAALGGFVVLVTPEPSVVRAATMAAIAMLGVLLGRPGVGMAILSLAVSLLLVVDPWLSSSLGFALSAAATGSLLLFARPLAVGLQRVLPRALALALAVPLAAQLACGPLLVLIEPSVPVYGVLANLLAAPAAPMATIIGLAACLAAPLPLVQSGLAAIAWLPASWIAATAQTVTTLPGDLVPWIEGWPGAALLAVVGVAVGVLVGVVPAAGGVRRGARCASGALLAVVVGIASGGVVSSTIAGRWTLPSDWSLIACDVGQGDAVLIRSEGRVALVDTGPDPAALDACLRRVGIDRIDLLILTHFDLDHVGGVDVVSGRVDAVLHGPVGSAADERVLRDLSASGASLVSAAAGAEGPLGGGTWRVLWPRAGSRAFPPGNDASVVLDVRGGGVPATLLLGDLSASAQRALAASGVLRAPYDVVKVAHHGSADQDAALYAAARPAVALVTVGADNDYGHPRDEILDVLAGVGARIARTDTEGLITVSVRQDALVVRRESVPGPD